MTGNRTVDRIEFATLCLHKLTVEFVLHGVSRGIQDVAGPFLVKLSKQAQVTFQGAMQCGAPTD